jgi:hypothetical protein
VLKKEFKNGKRIHKGEGDIIIEPIWKGGVNEPIALRGNKTEEDCYILLQRIV